MKKYDTPVAIFFAILTLAFLVLSATNNSFFHWVYDRHQNQLSWFIRPVFLIPFCYFAYKRSRSGISITIFLLFTSMFWFPEPANVSDEVKAFLQFEKDWLGSSWDMSKIMLALTVPFSFLALGFSFWKRSLWMGLAVVVLMATGKIIWSIYNAGESGKSILVPAITGLIICCALIFFGFRRLKKAGTATQV